MLENKKFMEYFISELVKAQTERQLNQRGKNGMGRPSKSGTPKSAGRCHIKKNVKVQGTQNANKKRKNGSDQVPKRNTLSQRVARILVSVQRNSRKLCDRIWEKNKNVKKSKKHLTSPKKTI